MATCPICGAALPGAEQCRERFELCLTKDFEQPTTYGAVHLFIVACYMLQHNAYSREGWLATRGMLAEVIRQGTEVQELRRRNRRGLDGGRRDWSITRGNKIPAVDAVVWSRTVADVRLDTPEAYREDARRWAESVLADTEALVHSLEQAPKGSRA